MASSKVEVRFCVAGASLDAGRLTRDSGVVPTEVGTQGLPPHRSQGRRVEVADEGCASSAGALSNLAATLSPGWEAIRDAFRNDPSLIERVYGGTRIDLLCGSSGEMPLLEVAPEAGSLLGRFEGVYGVYARNWDPSAGWVPGECPRACGDGLPSYDLREAWFSPGSSRPDPLAAMFHLGCAAPRLECHSRTGEVLAVRGHLPVWEAASFSDFEWPAKSAPRASLHREHGSRSCAGCFDSLTWDDPSARRAFRAVPLSDDLPLLYGPRRAFDPELGVIRVGGAPR